MSIFRIFLKELVVYKISELFSYVVIPISKILKFRFVYDLPFWYPQMAFLEFLEFCTKPYSLLRWTSSILGVPVCILLIRLYLQYFYSVLGTTHLFFYRVLQIVLMSIWFQSHWSGVLLSSMAATRYRWLFKFKSNEIKNLFSQSY